MAAASPAARLTTAPPVQQGDEVAAERCQRDLGSAWASVLARICSEADAPALRWLLRACAKSGARFESTAALTSIVEAAHDAQRWARLSQRTQTGSGLLMFRGEDSAELSAGAEALGPSWSALLGAADSGRLAAHRLPQLSPGSLHAALGRTAGLLKSNGAHPDDDAASSATRAASRALSLLPLSNM